MRSFVKSQRNPQTAHGKRPVGMCVFLLSLQPTGRYVLVAASNRDAFFGRRTASAAFWGDVPCILAGRDIHSDVHGGTWLGIGREGKFSTLTSVRNQYSKISAAPKSRIIPSIHAQNGQPTPASKSRSRGHLVSNFLQSGPDVTSLGYCHDVMLDAQDYIGFNLITVNLSPTLEAAYCSNVDGDNVVQPLQPGIHGLSNHQLNSPWKKVTHGKEKFLSIIAGLEDCSTDREVAEKQLFGLLSDDSSLYPDPNVPRKGYPDECLKHVTSIFVSPIELIPKNMYGTRTSTVVMVTRDGRVTYTERTREQPVDLSNPKWMTSSFTFNIHMN